MVEKQYRQGEVIVREGEYGDSFFRVISGTVVVLSGEGTDHETILTELHDGDYFGELAVIEGYNRTATVIAGADGAAVCEISASELSAYFAEEPGKVMELMNYMSSRLRQLTADYDSVCALLKKVRSGEAPEEKQYRHYISDSRRRKANAVSEETLRRIHSDHNAGYVKRVNSFPAGTVIFREGDPGDCMFDIHFGSVGIYTGYGTPEEEKLTELGVNSFFGEMGLISKAPRSAAAVAMTDDTTLETIYEEDLEELFTKNPPKAEMILQHLGIRIRQLSNDYIDACNELADAAQ